MLTESDTTENLKLELQVEIHFLRERSDLGQIELRLKYKRCNLRDFIETKI